MATYDRLYEQEKIDNGEYPSGDDAVGKPKNKRGGIKNKIGPGGTKAKKTETTTKGVDDIMAPSDMDKANPESKKVK